MKLSIRSLCEKILQNKGEHRLVTFFKNIELFRDFTIDEILTFLENVPISRREYTTEEMVFHEGQGGVSMYFVLEGKVGIYKNYGKKDEIMLAEVGSGGFFGEISMLRESPRTATVVTIEPTVLLAISQKDIEDFMNNHPVLAYKLLRNFASKISLDLEGANRRIEVFEHRVLELEEENNELIRELSKCKEQLKRNSGNRDKTL